MKSKSMVQALVPTGIANVVSPRALTRRVAFQKWLVRGVRASWTLPTICVHRCRVR